MNHPDHASEAFPRAALERISHAIADAEAATGTRIHLSIRDFREASEAHLSLKELAQKEFASLRLHENEHRYGILLLILYHERKFYVYGDEGVHSRIHPNAWKDVAETLTGHFANGAYESGIVDAVTRIEQHLEGKLPKHRG